MFRFLFQNISFLFEFKNNHWSIFFIEVGEMKFVSVNVLARHKLVS